MKFGNRSELYALLMLLAAIAVYPILHMPAETPPNAIISPPDVPRSWAETDYKAGTTVPPLASVLSQEATTASLIKSRDVSGDSYLLTSKTAAPFVFRGDIATSIGAYRFKAGSASIELAAIGLIRKPTTGTLPSGFPFFDKMPISRLYRPNGATIQSEALVGTRYGDFGKMSLYTETALRFFWNFSPA